MVGSQFTIILTLLINKIKKYGWIHATPLLAVDSPMFMMMNLHAHVAKGNLCVLVTCILQVVLPITLDHLLFSVAI